MKMNKLLTSILSVAMIATSFVSFATTAAAENVLDVSTTIKEYDGTDTEFIELYGYSMNDLGSSAKIYTLETKVENLGASIEVASGRGGSLTYTGNSISMFSLIYAFDNGIIYSDEYGSVPPKSLNNDLGLTLATNKDGYGYITLVDQAANALPFKTAKEAAAAGTYSIDDVVFKAILVTNTSDFSVNVEALATITGIKDETYDVTNKIDYEGANVNYVTANPIAPSDEYAFSAGTENIYADGIVWAGASMTNFDTTANEYWAEFTATGVTEPRKTLIKNLPESEESITFDAVMWFAGEAKENVTFVINEYAIAE